MRVRLRLERCLPIRATCGTAIREAVCPTFQSSIPSTLFPGGGKICRTKAESQWIVATRLLYHLQYPVLIKSSAWDLPSPIFEIAIQRRVQTALPLLNDSLSSAIPERYRTSLIRSRLNTEMIWSTAF